MLAEPTAQHAFALLYDYEVYEDRPAGWAWSARYEGRVLILSVGHASEFDARTNLDTFRSNPS
jgi:hypothetical protein